jgi:hypothetical protein
MRICAAATGGHASLTTTTRYEVSDAPLLERADYLA